MSEWNPVSVERAILQTVNELAEGIAKASTAYEKYLQANHAYDLEYAKQYMAFDGAAHAKKYAAEIGTERERVDRDAADVAYRLVERTNKMLERKLDAIRSIGASVRGAYVNAGRGEW